jgi:hypothetical protein
LAKREPDAVAVSGVRIRLPRERWDHIVREHPELEGLQQQVLATVENPVKVLAGTRGEPLAMRPVAPGKFLVVVYKETGTNDSFVITAFLTRRIGRLERGTVVWPRQ